MKKVVAILLVLLLSLTVIFTGCNESKEDVSKDESDKIEKVKDASDDKQPQPEQKEPEKDEETIRRENVTEPGTLPIVKDKITLSAFIVEAVPDLKTNAATVELENRTNIHLDLMTTTNQAYSEKKQLIIASGDYPEIFLGGMFDNNDIMKYGVEQEIFQPINDLIEEYAPEVKKTDTQIDGFLKNLTAPDGNIYGLPSINICYHGTYSRKCWLNTNWLEKLNLEMPNTTEEFYNVLKAFRDEDPNGNNKKDEIPFSGAINTWNGEPHHFLMNAFIYDNAGKYLRNLDGKLDFIANKPEWRDGLRYINKLYKEGLIDPASFTQSADQLIRLGDNPTEILGAGTCGHLGIMVTISDENDRHKHYNPLPPLEGPSGLKVAPYSESAPSGARFVITDKCKNPEAAMRLGDYLYTEEGTLLIEAGPEDLIYRKAKSDELGINGKPAKYTWLGLYDTMCKEKNANWYQQGPAKRLSEFDGYRGFWTVAQDSYTVDGYEKRLFEATRDCYEPYKTDQSLTGIAWYTTEQIEELGQLSTNITDYVSQSTVRFIIGELDIDKDWDNYVKQLNNLDVVKYTNIYNDAYGLGD